MQRDNINQELGTNLKAARANKGWSLDACSAQTGVSKAMLGQIERGESSPTIIVFFNQTQCAKACKPGSDQ